MTDMDKTPSPRDPETEAYCLEGSYTPKDLKAFSTLLAARTAGSRIWVLGALGLAMLLGLDRSAVKAAPAAILLVAFFLLLRYKIMPGRFYKTASELPGAFEPRRILIDSEGVRNLSGRSEITFSLEQIQEVIATPDHLYIMIHPKQGVPIPKAWIGSESRVDTLTRTLLSRCRQGS